MTTKSKKILIIAEAGVNHNGSLERAKKMVDVALRAGADAVKFQTFKATKLASDKAPKAAYQQKNMPGLKENQLEMLKRLELSYRDFRELKRYCDRKKIMFLSTPFDEESADFLKGLVPMVKISSGDMTNLPFLEHVSRQHKPILLSTGMSTMDEVKRAVAVILRHLRVSPRTLYPPLTLLHCTTDYPCADNEVNLRALHTLRLETGLPVGYSDHTSGIEIALAAAAMEVSVIEKHFTLDKGLPGPDHRASLDPEELDRLVEGVRRVEKSLGSFEKKPTKNERRIMRVARKSLVAARNLRMGERFVKGMFTIKRPGHGIQPGEAQKALGLRLVRDKKADEVIFWGDLM